LPIGLDMTVMARLGPSVLMHVKPHPAHVGSISSRYNELFRDAPVSDVVHRGFQWL
jgi:hypothetical protein